MFGRKLKRAEVGGRWGIIFLNFSLNFIFYGLKK